MQAPTAKGEGTVANKRNGRKLGQMELGQMEPGRMARSAAMALALVMGGASLAACSSSPPSATGHVSSKVLLVGTFDGHRGQFTSIQAAVNAARPGDWILIAPGDYHPTSDATAPSPAMAASGGFGGVVVRTANLHIRGMNRNKVIIDGTKAGAPTPCDSAAAWQNFGALAPNGKPYGRNGIVVYKANDVWIQNLTACNFLNGQGSAGNEIWWDGGSGSGKIGLHGYWGSYLTATSTYLGNATTNAAYGIFANSAAGPASWNQVYASNFDDSGMYVGACQQVCDITINHAWMQYNILGYSGTNSGGAVVIENSRFDNNQDGFDTNTQIASDPPPPQNGDCPGHAISPITHTRSCWVFMHNDVYNNNYANAPRAPGYAGAGPLGTGMTVAGGRNDTVMNNTFSNNGAWGILFVPFPDSDKPFKGVTCANSGGTELKPLGCVYDPEGDALLHNTFSHNGFFGNPSNGDYGRISLTAGQPRNCFAGNVAPDGSSPANLQQTEPTCGPPTTKEHTAGALLGQVLCDTGFGTCPAGAHYPTSTKQLIQPLPGNLPTMPNPCKGVPANAWCKGGRPL